MSEMPLRLRRRSYGVLIRKRSKEDKPNNPNFKVTTSTEILTLGGKSGNKRSALGA
jgi:hypothetical protein